MALPAVGTRLSLSGHLGTIRYVGPVDGTKGTWLGVEWDDPSRGKHDGLKDDKRYFTCLVPGSGSFIRPTAPHISYGTSFVSALAVKYIELPHVASYDENTSQKKETVILGSSNGAIEVEAVRLDKIRSKLSKLESLKEASLDGEEVARVEEEGVIRQRCPNIRGLDLSRNLLPSWDVVALIASELHYLERLSLSCNRLQEPTLSLSHAFPRLQELFLSSTLTSWSMLLRVIPSMPCLKNVELGYNRISNLKPEEGASAENGTIEWLNFDTNALSDWVEICESLRGFTALSTLLLPSNAISTIPPYNNSLTPSPIHNLKHLYLSDNPLTSWKDIDAIRSWCPNLQGFSVRECKLVQDPETSNIARLFLISRLPSIISLDGSPLTARERTDAELFYLSYISRRFPEGTSDEEIDKQYGRWIELIQKHGRPDAPSAETQRREKEGDKLSNRLIQITVLLSPSPDSPPSLPPIPMSVLPTMPLRTFRLKLLKALKSKVKRGSPLPTAKDLEIYLKMLDGACSRLQDEGRELEWSGLENGSEVVVCF